ncbi:MAG: hypothetical protein OQJ81_07170 [Melioribacteraceae bacterium]|nr:hypothetical protein [Melioribacteraceae bacterium]
MNNKRSTFIFFTLILSISIYSLFDSDDPMEQLQKYYQNSEYEKSIKLAERILKNPNISDYDRSKTYIIKGVSEFSSNQFLNARLTFMEYIQFNESGNIDSQNVSPKIIAFFNEIKNNIPEKKI